MPENLFVFNGVNASTGRYLTPPLSARDVSKLAQGEAPDPAHLADLKARHFRDTEKPFGTIAEDPTNLAEVGWGVIFPYDSSPAVREALKPLLELRKGQAGKIKPGRYKEYAGYEGYRPKEELRAFLARHGAAAGMPADPDRVPYYLLLVGSPEQIPFSFQYQLDVVYAVGRLWFERPDGTPDLDAFARYAASAVAAEAPDAPLPAPRATLFGVRNPNDRATQLSADELIKALGEKFAARPKGWAFDARVGTRTHKADLAPLLGGAETPALLLTASHGVQFDSGDPRQFDHQGALLCQDWPGPEAGLPVTPELYFSADDVPDSARLLGLVAFHFACFGGGTPRQDDFPHLRLLDAPGALAPRPFVARLPQRLLGHPNGGALAVVSHVERAWSCSFHTAQLGSQVQVFEGTLGKLLDGVPVGFALEFFNQFYAALSTELSAALGNIKYGKVADDLALSSVWTANNDARSYLVFGDPATRVRVAKEGAAVAERGTIIVTSASPPTTGGSPVPPTPAPQPTPPGPTDGPTTQAFAAFATRAGSRTERRQRLLQALQGRRLDEAYLRPDIRRDLEDEAADLDPDQIVTPEQLETTRELAAARAAAGPEDDAASFALFSTDQVVIVPGFMASELSDVAPRGYGLIWLSLAIAFRDRLSALRLSAYDGSERALNSAARVEPTGAIPVVYDLLRADLEVRRYATLVHAVDWRKDLEIAADRLAVRLRTLAASSRPIHVIAHSQGAMVARRALQKLAGSPAADRVKNLVLLGPANFGTFSAVFAVAGTHSLLPPLKKYTVQPAEGFQPVLASMTGLYQLLPWDPARIPWLARNNLGSPVFWAPHVSVDTDRLARFFGWSKSIDSTAFDARTTVILGDNNGAATYAGAAFQGNSLLPSEDGLTGDGTVPNSCAVLPGVRTFLAPGTEHAQLPLYRSVLAAVRAVLKEQTPNLPGASSNFADHLTPVPFAAVSFVSPRVAAVENVPAAGAGGDALMQVARMVKAATTTGVRIRLTVEADPS